MRESMAGVIPGQREAGAVADGEYDGPTLRSVRESVRVPLRRVARLAGMSHGHLSKVERGEHGRPVTPAILTAYEKATGVRLAGATVIGRGEDAAGAEWRRGRLSDARPDRRGGGGRPGRRTDRAADRRDRAYQDSIPCGRR